MNHLKTIALSLTATGVLIAAAGGVAHAANTNTGTVGKSGIPRSVFKQDRQQAEAHVLNTTVADIQAAHQQKTFKQLVDKASLTRKTFAEKVRAELVNELTAQGYSQDQVTIALQQREIAHLRHHKS